MEGAKKKNWKYPCFIEKIVRVEKRSYQISIFFVNLYALKHTFSETHADFHW